MIRFLSLSLALLLCWSRTLAAQGDARDGALTLENRERTLRFTLLLDGDAPEYRVDRLTPDGATNVVLDRSPLGITRMHEDFTTGLEFVSASPPVDLTSVYRMVTGKQLDIRRRMRQRTFTFRNTSGALVTITARAMHDGVAFRYGFPRAAFSEDSLTGEATGFHLPVGGSAWMQPYQSVATRASYEGDYRNAIPIGTAAPDRAGWALPMLFHSNDEWVLVTEAGLDRTSYGVHVERRAEGGLYRVRLPEEGETNGVAPQAAVIGFPWSSPWRVIIVGQTLATIVESTAVTDLAPAPTTTDVGWIKPGRASWSWWSDTTSPRDYQKVFPFVGLASQLRWEYALLGPGWQEMGNGGDVNDLLEYAKARNVALTLWYDLGLAHSEMPDSMPRIVLTDPEARRAEFKRIAALGVKGITVDFMPSDKQYVIALYEDILRDAAANHLFVDFHGSTIPRGWQRTFPNLLSMEAVKGAEQYGDSTFEVNAALYNTIYPFTRNVIGPMDYTPMVLGDVPSRREHLTTNAHEVALSVVFESGLQHFVATPAMIDAQPEYVKEFLRLVPTVWDETRFIDGYPGRYVVLARRRGPDWYIGAITSDTLVSVAEVPLNFLGAGPYNVGLISDGDDYDRFASNAATLTNRDTMTVELAPSGGFVAQIKPIGAAPPTPPTRKQPVKPTPPKPAAAKPRVPPRREP